MKKDYIEGRWDYVTGKYIPAEPPPDFPVDDEVLFATYDHEGYEGYATVIYRRDGKFFEEYSSHCSCNGLEGQFYGNEITAESLALRLTNKEWALTQISAEATARLVEIAGGAAS
jgi:hypothetical protein